MTKYYTDINEISTLNSAVLGIDYSKRNIGIAISDHSFKYAMPLKVISIKDYNERILKILKIIDDYNICLCVFGMPWREGNLTNDQTGIILNFLKDFTKKYMGEVFLQDESMTTIDANSIAYNLGIHGIRNDHFAASVILQRFLSKYHYKSRV